MFFVTVRHCMFEGNPGWNVTPYCDSVSPKGLIVAKIRGRIVQARLFIGPIVYRPDCLRARLFKGQIVYRLDCAGPNCAGPNSVGPDCAGPYRTCTFSMILKLS